MFGKKRVHFRDSTCLVRYVLSECASGAGLVTVDEKGVLRAGPDTGAALLEVFSMDVCGFNQTLLISVKVSFFILLNVTFCFRFNMISNLFVNRGVSGVVCTCFGRVIIPAQ